MEVLVVLVVVLYKKYDTSHSGVISVLTAVLKLKQRLDSHLAQLFVRRKHSC